MKRGRDPDTEQRGLFPPRQASLNLAAGGELSRASAAAVTDLDAATRRFENSQGFHERVLPLGSDRRGARALGFARGLNQAGARA